LGDQILLLLGRTITQIIWQRQNNWLLSSFVVQRLNLSCVSGGASIRPAFQFGQALGVLPNSAMRLHQVQFTAIASS
jgi:hypothetical protein